MTKIPALDERLSLAAALFPVCAYGADIGADHGRLSCYLLKNDICARMCVADLSAPSLKKARTLLSLHGLTDRADFCEGDGLSVLPRPADAIAILGMGGHTLAHILTEGHDMLQDAKLILSAHTELPLVRETLCGLRYRIEEEKVAFAAGRYYAVLRAAPGCEALSEKQAFLGPRFMETNPPLYQAYIENRIAVSEKKQTEEGHRETAWLKEEWHRVRDGQND